LFFNKQKKIEGMITEYQEQIRVCLQEFKEVFHKFCQSSDIAILEAGVTDLHRHESKADDIRREAEDMMYSNALFPESRGDMLGLLETLDRVPNQVEKTVRMVLNQNIHIPEDICPPILKLVDVVTDCACVALEASQKMFSNFTTATVAIGKVDELESAADHLQIDLVRRIFAKNMKDIDKLLLRDLIDNIEIISDRAENVADRIRIMVAKRRI
jgi:uncharacterized protein